jgi:hypothetical protein
MGKHPVALVGLLVPPALPNARIVCVFTFVFTSGLGGSRKNWRRRPDLNRGWRFCRPLPYHLATAPKVRVSRGGESTRARVSERKMERETGFEPATSTLARSHSTTELFPLARTSTVPHGWVGIKPN